MKSEGQQTDWVARQREAKAYRVAAEYSMSQPYFSPEERAKRRDYYLAKAAEYEPPAIAEYEREMVLHVLTVLKAAGR